MKGVKLKENTRLALNLVKAKLLAAGLIKVTDDSAIYCALEHYLK
jgi:hypothetical protein